MEFQAGGLFMAAVQVMPEAGDRSLGARHSSRRVWTLLREDQLRALLLAMSALEPAIQLAPRQPHLALPSFPELGAHLSRVLERVGKNADASSGPVRMIPVLARSP